jgi:hypothetical protein
LASLILLKRASFCFPRGGTGLEGKDRPEPGHLLSCN